MSAVTAPKAPRAGPADPSDFPEALELGPWALGECVHDPEVSMRPARPSPSAPTLLGFLRAKQAPRRHRKGKVSKDSAVQDPVSKAGDRDKDQLQAPPAVCSPQACCSSAPSAASALPDPADSGSLCSALSDDAAQL